MKDKIEYYIIGSVDVIVDNWFDNRIADFVPDFFNAENGEKRIFQQTEGCECADEPFNKHRKYVGILTAEQLSDIKENYCIDTCETMGAMTFRGAMGAISWDLEITNNYGSDYVSVNLYISPIITDDESLEKEINRLPDAQKEIKINKIQGELEKVLVSLKNIDNDIISEINIDIIQVELEI